MDHDSLDNLLDGPTTSLLEKEIEELLGHSDSSKTLGPVLAKVDYVPTPLNQQGGETMATSP